MYIIYIISKLFQWFFATIIIIAKNFEMLQFRGKCFCNNDYYCNERNFFFDIMKMIWTEILTLRPKFSRQFGQTSVTKTIIILYT